MTKLTENASITDVQLLYGITPRALRHYENIGLIQAGRNGRNRRTYDRAIRKRIADIVLLRQAGLSLAEIRRYLVMREGTTGEPAAAFLRERLVSRRGQLDLMAKALERASRDMLPVEAVREPAEGLRSAQA